MSRWNNVPPARREAILVYNRRLAEEKNRSDDLQLIADRLNRMPPGQRKQFLSDSEIALIFARNGVEV